jgi:uncharacterized SAM-binding protein YcdF (DUF218 family)
MNNFVNKKTAIVILGGGIKKDEAGNWRTTNYDEPGDNFGVSGDRLRVVAANYLFKHGPEQLFIVSGGKGQLKDNPDAPTVAEVLKKELIAFGVPEEMIIKEENSGNTYEQLQEIKKIILEKELKNIGLLSNEWHLPRVKEMLERFDELRQIFESINVEFLSAEKICLEYDNEAWQEIIEQAYKSEGLKERIEREQKGVEDIKEGRYKIK